MSNYVFDANGTKRIVDVVRRVEATPFNLRVFSRRHHSGGDDEEEQYHFKVVKKDDTSVEVHAGSWIRRAGHLFYKVDMAVDTGTGPGGSSVSEFYEDVKTISPITTTQYIKLTLNPALGIPPTPTLVADKTGSATFPTNDFFNVVRVLALVNCVDGKITSIEPYRGNEEDSHSIPDSKMVGATHRTLDYNTSNYSQIYGAQGAADTNVPILINNAGVLEIQWKVTDTVPSACGRNPSNAGTIATGLSRGDHYHHISDSDHADVARYAEHGPWETWPTPPFLHVHSDVGWHTFLYPAGWTSHNEGHPQFWLKGYSFVENYGISIGFGSGYGAASSAEIDLLSETLIARSSGLPTVNWGTRLLLNSSSATSVNWESNILGGGNWSVASTFNFKVGTVADYILLKDGEPRFYCTNVVGNITFNGAVDLAKFTKTGAGNVYIGGVEMFYLDIGNLVVGQGNIKISSLGNFWHLTNQGGTTQAVRILKVAGGFVEGFFSGGLWINA